MSSASITAEQGDALIRLLDSILLELQRIKDDVNRIDNNVFSINLELEGRE